VAVGDYDNDGLEDLYVTAYGGNKLYRNTGDNDGPVYILHNQSSSQNHWLSLKLVGHKSNGMRLEQKSNW